MTNKITTIVYKSDNVYTIKSNNCILKFYFLNGVAKLTIHTTNSHPCDLEITELKTFLDKLTKN